MIAGGIIVGLIASQNTDAGTAAEDGIIGAGVVGLIGAPLAFLPHPQFMPLEARLSAVRTSAFDSGTRFASARICCLSFEHRAESRDKF